MDRVQRVEQYRSIIKSVLKEYARLFHQKPEGVDVVALCDESVDTYAIINLGWDGNRRTNVTSVLMRIMNDKIWVEEDNTLYRFVDELLDHGIKKDEIVLAFKPPSIRPYTEFAVA
ncbi:MAG: element excision factor XisI family protein [Chloroflexota bacterium]